MINLQQRTPKALKEEQKREAEKDGQPGDVLSVVLQISNEMCPFVKQPRLLYVQLIMNGKALQTVTSALQM